MRQFLIKILLRLLTPPIQNRVIDNKKIQKWLWEIYPQGLFRDYIYKRDLDILQQIGGVVDREKYLILLGERIELGRLLYEAKTAYQKQEKEIKSKNQLTNKK